MQTRAETLFGARLGRLGHQLDGLKGQIRRYVDACYLKDTVGSTAGTFSGSGDSLSVGAVVTSDGDAVYADYQQFQFTGTVASESRVANETTAPCRLLWSDIDDAANVVVSGLEDVNELARRAGIYPGVMRGLFAEHHLR